MAMLLLLFICIPAFVAERSGTTLSVTTSPSRCGDWTPYKDVKCLKIATHAGFQTMEDAEIVCKTFSEVSNKESFPHLMTIKTKEEQAFIQHFLLDENNIIDNVWLGLKKKGNSDDFEWKDGISVVYSNWANQSVTDDKHQCVQMASGQEFITAGLWVRVNCKKGAMVVCERTQTWSLDTMQNMFMNYKLEQERIFSSLSQKYKASEKEIDDLKQNPVPLGFIYTQLPNQDPPSTLWPHVNWTDVSSSYAGLFFRVVGGQSAPFGQVQEGNSSRLEQVQHAGSGSARNSITIPSDGTWSDLIYTGGRYGIDDIYLEFRLSGQEVRPRNQAIKLWQRIQ